MSINNIWRMSERLRLVNGKWRMSVGLLARRAGDELSILHKSFQTPFKFICWMFGFCLFIVQFSFSTIFHHPTTTSHSPPPWMPCTCHITAVSNGDRNTNPHLLLDYTATPNDEDEPTCHPWWWTWQQQPLPAPPLATATSAVTPFLDACSCHVMAMEMAGPTPTPNDKDETICHVMATDLHSHIITLSLFAMPRSPCHSTQLNWTPLPPHTDLAISLFF